MDLPKIIWSYWEDGADNAPDVVQHCLESWRKLNNGYEIRLLDRTSFEQHTSELRSLDLFRDDITVVKRANLIRLAVLHEHGGVWADATLFCNRPLDEWLPDYFISGFFAFRNEKKARDVCTWFLAAQPGNVLAAEFLTEYRRNFEETIYTNQDKSYYKPVIKLLYLVLNRNTYLSQFWVHPWLRRTIRMYPYFHMHFTFNKIIYRRGEACQVWQRTPVYFRSCSSRLRKAVSDGTDMAEIGAFIRSAGSPVHKLNWRSNYSSERWQQAFGFLDAYIRSRSK